MEKITRIESRTAVMPTADIDTDQIVPARFLRKPRSDDFGAYLFRDLRFGADGSEIAGFVLNRPPYRSAKIVVAERNFGCGSSREQAVWSLHDYGFRAAIAPSFGDIFATNATKNGLLPVVLPEPVVVDLLEALDRQPGARIAIDLPSQVVVAPDGTRHRFDVDPFVKHCLIQGLDEIAYTLTLLDRITAFEARYASETL